MFKTIRDHRLTFALLLALPGLPMLAGILSGDLSVHAALHPTGETAARLTVLAMIISPLRVIWPKSKFLYWFLRRRRDIGIAAFVYALAHTVLYAIDKGALAPILAEATSPGLLTGWLAMALFLILGLTSNDWSVRTLGSAWKGLQRWVYPAAALTLAHWLLVSHGIGGALVHAAPLMGLEAWRIWKHYQTTRLALA